MSKKLYIAAFVFFIVSSCQNSNTEKANDLQKSLCEQINEDSLVTLKGTLNINSKDTIVFENIDKVGYDFDNICLSDFDVFKKQMLEIYGLHLVKEKVSLPFLLIEN